MDQRISWLCTKLPQSSCRILQDITVLGDSTWYLVGGAVAIVLFRFIWKRPCLLTAASLTFTAVAVTGLATLLIKPLLGRNRPVRLHEQGAFGFTPFTFGYDYNSMPSGHAGTITAVAASLALAFPRCRVPLFCAAGLVLASRVMLNKHYLSDVLTGALMAIIVVRCLAPWILSRTWGCGWSQDPPEIWRAGALPGYRRGNGDRG